MKKYIINLVTRTYKLFQLVTEANNEEEAKNNFLQRIKNIASAYDKVTYKNIKSLDELINILYEDEIIVYCDECILLEDHFTEILDNNPDTLKFRIIFKNGIEYHLNEYGCNLSLESLLYDEKALSPIYDFNEYKEKLLA